MKKIFSRVRNNNGQVLVLVGVLIPVIFLFVAAAGDFGWYYLNQSRLQNAADSAVVAATQNSIKREGLFSDYISTQFISNNDADLTRLIAKNTTSARMFSTSGDGFSTGYTELCNTARDYAALNLATDGKVKKVTEKVNGQNVTKYLIQDGWNNDVTVKPTYNLYGKDDEKYGALYYVVTLDETIDHLFGATKYLGELPLKATAVVKIQYQEPAADVEHGPSLYKQMRIVEELKTYPTWNHIQNEYSKLNNSEYKNKLGGAGNADDAAKARSLQSSGNHYERNSGNAYRTETLVMHGSSAAVNNDGGRVVKGSVTVKTSEVDQTGLDSLFIDFKIDFKRSGNIGTDWDLGNPTKPDSYNLKDTGTYSYLDGRPTNADGSLVTYKEGDEGIPDGSLVTYKDKEKIITPEDPLVGDAYLGYRIHSLINIGRWHEDTKTYTYPYKVRADKDSPDPLYAYIESENIVDHEYQNGNTGLNTVRQIIINVNAANTGNDDRPVIFFYDGPETKETDTTKNTWKEQWREGWKYDWYEKNQRKSLPVILNLNADFKGILFMPNSPVVINGNNHSFEGFIVAKSIVKLKTIADFEDEVEFTNEVGSYKVDSKGNPVTGKYKKSTDRSTEKKIVYVNEDDETKTYTYTLIEDEATSMISGAKASFTDREKARVPIYPMWVDEIGNVQYSKTQVTPSLGWASDKAKPLDPLHGDEKAFKISDFKLSSSKYESFNLVALVNYTYLKNDSMDNIFLTGRSDWID